MAELNFQYQSGELQEIADTILKKSIQSGASNAQVELSESISTGVEVLNQEIENFETSQESQLLLTVFKNRQKGHIGISNIQLDNLDETIQKALDIATYTQEDMANGLLESEFIVTKLHDELELYKPYKIDNLKLIKDTKNLESLALQEDARIKAASDGASTSLTRYNFILANTHGLNHGYQTSRYSKYVSLIGNNAEEMQTDYWYSSKRDYNDLLSNKKLAESAAKRLSRRLNKGSYASGKPQVIFDTNIAKSIIGSLIGALSGGSLYRRLSFLNDSIDQQVLPDWFDLIEDPFIIKGLSSCYFDNEGSQVNKRYIIQNGTVKGYLLSSYTARKMKMVPTGNAGGSHNLMVKGNFSGNLEALASSMYNGIIIIETIGSGLNMVTGDYSVGASGLVVVSGKISHFVDNLTIAGNMREIYKNILQISNDSESDEIMCGSMLIKEGVIQVRAK